MALHQKNIYTCHYCDKNFNRLDNLNRHIKAVHVKNPEDLRSCLMCDAKFNDLGNLKRHMRTSHKDVVTKVIKRVKQRKILYLSVFLFL